MSLARQVFAQEKYTVADILAMQEAGLIDESDNFELIDGEIIPTNPKHLVHESIKSVIGMAMSKACPRHFRVGFETTIFLSETTLLEPDLCLYPLPVRTNELTGPDLLIAIEVAATTLAHDRGRKAQVYARHGVRELWVIDAVQRRTFIHRGPSAAGWASVIEHGPEFVLTIAELPGFGQRLDEI